ncbi:MAG: pyridoxal-phosphate dependent enzyme [Anaerolineae bacterium]|nr:pyridoxal-phosphate dependent enzyme [Anaerolineae bacterium]
MMPTFADVERARERLRPYLAPTPLEEAIGAAGLWLKLENANQTHSFKCRGALNAMLQMDDAARARGVVAVSSGNHAQGVAWAARILGLQARIVMHEGVSRRKLAGVRRLGAEAILIGETYEEAEAEARRLCRELGATWLSPYNDAHVVAGAGTVGLEIIEQLPQTARIVVPVGGGGLIAGIGLAAKHAWPDIEIVGVNALASPDMYNEVYQLELPLGHDTLADALPGAIEAGSITRELVGEFVDRIVLVSEDDIRRAMQQMLFEQGWIAEGGGVAGLAAIENGSIELDRPTVAVITGGNVDADVLRDVMDV